ncbi:uncharacterized protein LOC128238913 [Mya arenaria]|uniref:uncharacterized protein LOC128238913 n=1 Tax=Mya arenaria TaxID=6604 RepID=UPI0022E26766|nr:uncharacterized protein LOC128238913 [Mya arenaria]XP_052811193.1 uncharacterized protein LOC128238913 [Mya arenaria]
MVRGPENLSDEDRFNNFLQMLMRCCVKVMRTLLSKMVSWLGYSDVDGFLSSERTHLKDMQIASLPKSQAILYPGTATDIKQWDLSLLNCVLTQIQRKIILKEFGNPIDPVLINNRVQVTATKVGKAYERKLYPASGNTDINKWPMSVCSCLLSVLSPKPQTSLVRIAESLDDIRELRNKLCHPDDPAMTTADYELHMPVIKTFIDLGLAFLGDDAFESEIKKEMDDIENGKLKTYLLIDHRHLQQSYHDDKEIIQRLDKIEKAVEELPKEGELNVLLFFGRLPREQKDLLYASFIETFTKCLANNMPETVDDVEFNQQIIHASCMAWKYLENPYKGRHVLGVRPKCVEVKIGFDNVRWMWSFIKDYFNCRLELAFEPMQTLLRRQKGCEHLEITIAIPDMFSALMKIGQAVDMDIDSVMFLLEMIFQKSQLRLEKSFAALCDMSTQTSQREDQFFKIGSRKMESNEHEKPAEEYTVDDANIKFTPWIQKAMKCTVDGAGNIVKTLIYDETGTPIEEYTVDEAGNKVKKLKQDEMENPIEEYTVDDAGNKVKNLKKESKKEQVSFYCEPCLQNKIKVNYMIKCKDCDKMLCSDCARVHRNSKTSRNHIMIEQQPDDLTNLKFTPATTINVNFPSDADPICLNDMVLLGGDRLILVDLNNKKVKMVDLGTNNLMSQISVPGGPRNICLLPGDRVAVYSVNGSIQFMKALGQLTLERSIEVGRGSRSIGYHNERLIVAYMSGIVVIMDMTGNRLKNSEKSIFSHILSLTVVNEGQDAVIFVSAYENNTITKLDMDLNILQIFQNPELRGPAGMIAVGSQLLICGSVSNNIMCLHLPNRQMTQLLGKKDGIQKPLGVCFSQQQNRLYVNSDYERVCVYRPSINF